MAMQSRWPEIIDEFTNPETGKPYRQKEIAAIGNMHPNSFNANWMKPNDLKFLYSEALERWADHFEKPWHYFVKRV